MRVLRRWLSAKNASTDSGSDRAVDHGGGGAVAQQLVEEERRDPRGVGRVLELLLLDEGVFLQPFQQLRAVGADHLGLRVVDVGVDQPGQDELIRIVVDRRARRQRRQQRRRLAHGGDRPPSITTRPSWR